jgi:hypothetical protein
MDGSQTRCITHDRRHFRIAGACLPLYLAGYTEWADAPGNRKGAPTRRYGPFFNQRFKTDYLSIVTLMRLGFTSSALGTFRVRTPCS